jgi:uncharacterized membrane protein
VPSPESERMDALSEAIVRLLCRQEDTDRRLAELEKALGLAAPLPEPAPPPLPQPPPRLEAPPQMPVEPPSLQAEKPGLETKVGLAWINRIGAVTFALFVAFVFKYAVDNAWIGPGGRVALGVVAGLATLAFADSAWRLDQKTYAQGISGLGIAVLYLSFYASFGFYHLIEPGFAFVLMALATAMAAALALRYDAPAIAALGLLGGYATPVLLSTGEDRPWALFSWVLLLNLGALVVARFRKWRSLEALAFTATVFLYGAWLLERFTAERRTVAALFAFVYYALFATSETPLIFYLAQGLATMALPVIWREMVAPYALGSLLLAAGGVGRAFGLPLLGSSGTRHTFALSATFAAFCLAYAEWSGYFRTPQPVGPVFLFLTAAFVMFLCPILFRGAVFTRQDALLLALNGAGYFGVSYDLLRTDYRAWLGLFAVAVAAAYLTVAYLLWRKLPQENRDTRAARLAIGIALTFVTLAAPIQFSEYRITMAWAIEMAALVWIGRQTHSKGLIYGALAIFVLVLFRLDVVDSWMYPSASAYQPIANARFLTFLISAAACWASAYWIKAGWEALTLYLGGHYVMLWILSLEAIGWVARSASPENLLSAESAAVSILMACYAVLLVGAGVVYRSALNRILGLGLIGLVVGKLYLYDVWLLVRIYRIAAFGALGALLLLTSYVYSRNRASIESWWNDRNTGA